MKKTKKKVDNTPKLNKFTYYLCPGTDYLRWVGLYPEYICELIKERPTLIMLGGNATKEEGVAFTYAKTLKTLLGPFRDDTHVITVNYNGCVDNDSNMAHSVNDFVRNVFVPMFTYDNSAVPVEQARRNARQLTIMAHCYGVYDVLNRIENVAHDIMLGFGYTQQEVCDILSQVAAVTYGAASNLKYMSELNCVSITDRVKKEDGANNWRAMLEDIDSVDIASKDKAYLLKKYVRAKRFGDKKLKFLHKFTDVNSRCYIHKVNDNKYTIQSGHLTWETEQEWDYLCGDHLIGFMRLGEIYERYYAPTEAGKYMTRMVSSYICQSVANGMINRTNDNFIPFAMPQVMTELSHFVAPLNYYNQLRLDKQDKFNMATNKHDDDMVAKPNKTDYPELFEKE